MSSLKNCTERISYKGKNLNIVLAILDEAYIEMKPGEVLVHRIIFEQREVEITASFDVF